MKSTDILVSGIKPSGRLHIGNYLGALKNFVDLQNSGDYKCYFFIADLHSLTEDFEPKEKQRQILELAADFLAAGLDPKRSVIFQQSQIPAHSELAWILNTITPMGELRRMTQYKEKIMDQTREELTERVPRIVKEGILQDGVDMGKFENVGLFDYPVLMAADILLYDAKFVPVGEDQQQHLELARTLARKFNAKFGKTFVEPKAVFTETPRVMSVDDPTKKMSKSRPAGCLFLDDSPEEIKSKIGRAVTDSGSEIEFDEARKPGVSNLLSIFSGLSDEPIEKLEKRFAGATYVSFKAELVKLASDHFATFRKEKKTLLAKPALLRQTLRRGSGRAAGIAARKIAEVKKKVGLAV